ETFFENCEVVPSSLGESEKDELANRYVNLVQNLELNQSISLEAGWTKKGAGGHFLLYTFTKKEGNTYDIYLYNTGEGIQYHPQKIIQKGLQTETLVCPYLKYQSVPQEKIGVSQIKSSPGFFKRLIEINSNDCSIDSAALLYESILGFGRFHEYLVDPAGDSAYIPPQKSGTCTYDVLRARLRSEFASEEEFIRFDFILQYNCLKVLFQKYPKEQLDAVELIEKQGENLLRSLAEIAHLFPKEEVTRVRMFIENMLQEAASIKQIQPKIFPIEAKKVQKEEIIKLELPCAKIRMEQNDLQSIAFWEDKEFLTSPVTVKNIQNHLNLIRKIKNDEIFRYSLEKLSRGFLRFSSNDLQTIPKEEIPKIIQDIKDSCHRYFYMDTPFDDQVCVNTIFSLSQKSYDLACEVVPELKEYTLSTEALKRVLEHGGITEYSPEERALTKKIDIYDIGGAELIKKPKIFNFVEAIESHITLKDIPEHSFLMELADNPDKIKTVQDKLSLFFKNKHFNSEKAKIITNLREMVHFSCSLHPVMKERVSLEHAYEARVPSQGTPFIFLKFEKKSDLKAWWDPRWHFYRTRWMNYHLNPDELTTFFKENETLVFPEDTSSKLIPSVITANKDLRSSRLLHYFSSEYMKLTDFNTQKLFFHYLFQSTSQD
ncbi:MAG: hypothetical protein JSS09_01570, partial [Verrucomicrobia bacterium]|nr:hypothetical protein [Verrucomicrobiota bacterium]